MTGVERDKSGGWKPMDNDSDSAHAASMLNMRESGQLISSPYNQWGQHLPPSYSDIVSPEEALRRAALAERSRKGLELGWTREVR